MSAVRELPRAVPAGPFEYVQPGQISLSNESRVLSTILGSCVAVCLWDPVSRAGGMSHFLLPTLPAGATASARYAEVAMTRLLEGVLRLGTIRCRLEARVFGGARVLGSDDADHLGARNARAAIALLESERIPLVGGEVGGRRGRRLLFDLGTGQVWVRLL